VESRLQARALVVPAEMSEPKPMRVFRDVFFVEIYGKLLEL
jgi:hypothetical protein